MAFGTLKADTLTHSTAGSLDTNFVVEGSAKHWTQFSQQGVQALDDSFNCSTITDGGVGITTLSFSSSTASGNYSAQCTHSDNQMNTAALSKTTSSYRVDARNDAGTFGDKGNYGTVVHGDLA